MTRLPPGQIETRRFPVVGERSPSADLLANPEGWTLSIAGEVDTPLTIGLARFLEIATETVRFDIHCVTSWTRFDTEFTGVPLASLFEEVGVTGAARFVSFSSYSERGHHTSLAVDVARSRSWLVHQVDGEPLSVEHGGPVRVVTPGRYFYKSLKWVGVIDLLVDDRLGWWETNSSYHNNADPTTGTERFSTGSLRPEQLRRFLEADSYDKYRGRVMLGLDLRSWTPATKDLSGLHLKYCDLSRVDLSGADLRRSNLSLSDLTGANLSDTDFEGADLEGCDLSGADLTGANLSWCALSATRFVSERGAARVDGMRMEGAWGLLEEQERYLRDQGVTV